MLTCGKGLGEEAPCKDRLKGAHHIDPRKEEALGANDVGSSQENAYASLGSMKENLGVGIGPRPRSDRVAGPKGGSQATQGANYQSRQDPGDQSMPSANARRTVLRADASSSIGFLP